MGSASTPRKQKMKQFVTRYLTLLFWSAYCSPFVAAEHNNDAEAPRENHAYFKNVVQPILKEHCYDCHSHQAKKLKGGLVLDSRLGWQKGGDSGPAIEPGKPEQSLLISAVRYKDLEMPPQGKLPHGIIKQLERWVADGAYDPRDSNSAGVRRQVDVEAGRQHWAFRPLRESAPPAVQNKHWPRMELDRYISRQLEQVGLKPVADADPYTWLRRVSFDLTGLPPSVEQVRAFAQDQTAEAREKVVDRLLASRAFGERWARHWLDLVGYADQVGTSNSVFAQHAWRYRQYVIDAYASDKPFDAFVREQIAGDLLEANTVAQRAAGLTATGFLVLGDIEIVESDKAKMFVDIVDQQLKKVGKAFLGLTLDCARCHDHKFDPIPQRDYYAMAGFFHSTSSVYKTDRGVWSDINQLELPETEKQKAKRSRQARRHADQLTAWKSEREEATKRRGALDQLLKNQQLSTDERAQLTKEQKELAGRLGELSRRIRHAEFFSPTVPKAHGVKDVDRPEDMRITIRGNPRALAERVPRGFLQVVRGELRGRDNINSDVGSGGQERPPIEAGQSGRRELAEWIVSTPLAARVVVNRIWQKLFGEGLVRSVDYFGVPGDLPTHPQLLDYLARRFVDEGWSQKQLIRELVLSRTYGLSSLHDEQAYATDPDNRWLWRMNRFRLDAEALRDAMLLAAGQLSPSSGGPSLPLEYPENVGGLDPKDVNPPSFRLSKWRPQQEFERTIYLPIIRHAAQPGPAELRNVFDFAQPSQFTGKRAITAVPTQALFLMNSPVVKKHATALATRISSEKVVSRRLELLWLTLLNRPIDEIERMESRRFLKELGDDGWSELCHALLASNEFLMRM